ncbi:MMPL family transporter [Longivirga aurantiaca]|uniref:MMPL family transporter n=1 Tax=Longivirga aurantiaca TaxID=1837743 RepID=A0ABW1SVD5_9ACTN
MSTTTPTRSGSRAGWFDRLGAFTVRRRRLVLVVAVIGVVVAAVVGGGVFSRLSSGGFDDPGSESARAADQLLETFDAAPSDIVLIARSVDGASVDTAEVAAAGAALAQRLAGQGDVRDVTSYWATGAAAMRSTDGTLALVTARLTETGDAAQERAGELAEELSGFTDDGVLEVRVSGSPVIFAEVGSTIEKDLVRAESIAVPVTMLLLLLVFGTLVAAGLPAIIGAVAVLGSFLALWTITQFTDVSVFAINLVTALGIGLGIDYALFMVTRFREELARGRTPDEAVIRTVRTAGRTVVYSGITVAISLSALLVFPQFFLRSFAYAGIATVVLAVIAAVVVLPAALSTLGTKVDRFRVLRSTTEVRDDGFWFRLSHAVMRRPWPVLVGGVALLVALGLPFFNVAFGQTDDRVLPASAQAAQAGEWLRTEFDSRESDPLTVVAATSTVSPGTVGSYAAQLSEVGGVARVDSVNGSYVVGALVADAGPAAARFVAESGTGTWLSVVTDVEPYSAEGRELVEDLRAIPSPLGETLVGGSAATFADSQTAMGERLPWAIGIIAIATFVLLFLFTGSVVLPLKALVLNTLSLSAMFGAMVWIFQEGHLSQWLGGFTVTGELDTAMPILMFCIAFGLSMDYEVFLLSRIKEEYDRTGDNAAAVALGMQRTGRLITSAAALLAIVFIAFATSGVTIIKMMGVGVALAVLVDATLIRGLMVPAFMRVMGDANWWAPAWLKRLHDRFGISEGDADEDDVRDLRDDTVVVG